MNLFTEKTKKGQTKKARLKTVFNFPITEQITKTKQKKNKEKEKKVCKIDIIVHDMTIPCGKIRQLQYGMSGIALNFNDV